MLFTCGSWQSNQLCQKEQTYFVFSGRQKTYKEILVQGMQSLSRNKRAEEVRQERETAVAGNLNLPHFDDPKTNNEWLLNYQYDYLVNHDETAWANLWKLSTDVAGRMLANFCKKRRIRFSETDWEDKRSEAVMYVLRRYKTRKDYHIESNFPLQIWYGVKHVLDYRTNADELIEKVYDILNTGGIKIDV